MAKRPYYLFPLLSLVLAGMAPIEPVSHEGAPSEQEQHRNTVTGVLERLDLNQGKGELRTDLGKPIFFEVVQPELFQRLTVGERVTIELDAAGRAVKVIAVPAPELERPPS
ncbi:MAG TPA: hypothetical protein VFX10_06635 [Nitrospira sp.]|nr:hypothetical protein [Nitrospira sp.]